MGRFVTLKVPLPLENATGSEVQPGMPVSARSVRPSPLKSPGSTFAPGDADQVGKLKGLRLVTLKVPLPFDKATGRVVQPGTPVTAMSVRPSPLKSPGSTRAPG